MGGIFPVKRLLLIGALILSAGNIGCVATPVQPYQPSYENVQLLKSRVPPSQGAELGSFRGGPERISVRGTPALSPVGSNYADYLRQALESELQKAELLKPSSGVRVSGTIIGTDIETGAGSTAQAWLEAEIVVSGNGTERYRRVLRADHRWESSFVGAIAIPLAFQAYPQLVERFLSQLYADIAFTHALRG